MMMKAMLWMMLGAILMPAMMFVAACTGTRAAYKEAENPYEYAFVLTEHYAALVKEAADLKEKPGTPPEVIAAMQAADRAAKPVIMDLAEVADAYQAAKTAETEAQLQEAINRAITVIAEMVRAVQKARTSARNAEESMEEVPLFAGA